MSEKRKLYDELMEGIGAMRNERAGKITLRTHEVQDMPRKRKGKRRKGL